jgi:solute carrier family 13 (sodium-dependent dicarboxylate transporter), member 2/3/5
VMEGETHRPEGGVEGTLSAGERAFENRRGTVGLFLGPLFALALYLVAFPGLSREAHLLAAILAWVVVWWICEPIPLAMTAILGAVLCVSFGIADAKKVLAPFSDPVIYLFLGSFVLARAMMVHELDRRFVCAVLSLKGVGNRTNRILLAFGAICAAISMWISNTATAAMMFPIGVGIAGTLAEILSRKSGMPVDARTLRYGTGLMLMTAYAASTGGIGTPVGTPPNLIGIAMIEKLVGVRISFLQWMAFAVPLLIVLFGVLYLIIFFLHRPELSRVEGGTAYVARERERLGPWTRGQKNALAAFLVTVTLWLVPGILAVVCEEGSPLARSYASHMPEAVAALTGAILLFLLPTDWKRREFTLTWREAVHIDWGTLILFGGGLTLGALMFETGLAEAVGQGLLKVSGATSLWGITLGAIFTAILVSEASSNTASANMVIPVMIALAQAANVNPIPPAIGATLGASWGFMLPVSTPPNAIVYGSGMVPITKMIRAGVLFDVLGGFILWIGLRVLLPLVGLA